MKKAKTFQYRFRSSKVVIALFLLAFALPGFVIGQDNELQRETPQSTPHSNDDGNDSAKGNDVPEGKRRSTLAARDFMDQYHYEPKGKRDPFSPYVNVELNPNQAVQHPLELYNLNQLKVLGVMWDVAKPQAMIQDPTGTVHFVGLNQKMGRNQGYLAVIREGECVVVEEIIQDEKVSYVTRIMQVNQ